MKNNENVKLESDRKVLVSSEHMKTVNDLIRHVIHDDLTISIRVSKEAAEFLLADYFVSATGVEILDIAGRLILNLDATILSNKVVVYRMNYLKLIASSDDGALMLVDNSSYLLVDKISDEMRQEFIDKWESLDTYRVVITHANCYDGIGTAMVANMGILTNIRTLFVDYNKYNIEDILEAVEGAVVYIGDFSFPVDEFKRIQEASDMTVMIDHHASAMNMYRDSNATGYIMDMTASGTVLAAKFFSEYNTLVDVPYIFHLIGDRDVWNWYFDPDTKLADLDLKRRAREIFKADENEITAKIRSLISFTVEHESEYIENTLRPLLPVLSYEKERIITAANKLIKPVYIDDIKFISKEGSSDVSEVCNRISLESNGRPAAGWFIDETNHLLVSLRDATGKFPVNEIAGRFGGGGHPAAAGFRIPLTDPRAIKFIREGVLKSGGNKWLRMIKTFILRLL